MDQSNLAAAEEVSDALVVAGSPEETRFELVERYLAAKRAMDDAKNLEFELRGVIASWVPETKGTRTVEVGNYEIKVSRSPQVKYDKDTVQRLYVEHAQIRDAFRISFDERTAEMEKVLILLKLGDEDSAKLATEIEAARTVGLSTPQVKVEFAK